jgi:hypothetical protein
MRATQVVIPQQGATCLYYGRNRRRLPERNRGPVRVQTEAKQAEIQKQTQQMLAAGIIEVSPASFYSQVHIAPKPGGFRFCIDFRKFNDATASASWPIPNIQQMIIRIIAHRASIYGIMDLTLGYHQAPISLNTRIHRVYYIRWYISMSTKKEYQCQLRRSI